MDDVSDIQEMYNHAPDREHERLERHQLEHDITWRYFERYLPARGSILEVGAATGRYTQALAQRGYQVTAVDFSETLLARCRKHLTEAGLHQHVTFITGDARYNFCPSIVGVDFGRPAREHTALPDLDIGKRD